MSNKYLEKVAVIVRSLENLVGKTNNLAKAVAGRERRVNLGISSKADPIKAKTTLGVLQNQSKFGVWK